MRSFTIYIHMCIYIYICIPTNMFKAKEARQIMPCDSLFLSRNQRVSGLELALPTLQQAYQKLKEARAVNVFGSWVASS